MAYLNVRERRLETRIAYVGPAQGGKQTNLARLGEPRLSDDVAALFWRPTRETSFRDCDVRVELVAPRSPCSRDRVQELLRQVDGVVFVADADPAAQERNRELLGVVREALAKDDGWSLPVVVQVNKQDLPGALTAADVVGSLAVGELPHIAAAAARGEGVLETAERVFEMVLSNLQRREPSTIGAPAGADAAPEPSSRGARESNPLLNALRQVLRETAESQTDELERRTHVKLDRALALQEALAIDVSRMQVELTTHHRELTNLGERVAALTGATSAVGDAVQRALDESARQAKVLDQITRSDREQQTLLSATKRAVEGVAAEPAKIERSVAGLRAELEALAKEAAALRAAVEPTASATRDLAPRLGAIETNLVRALRDGISAVTRALEENASTNELAHGAIAEKTGETLTALAALIEELKKPKKGWFS